MATAFKALYSTFFSDMCAHDHHITSGSILRRIMIERKITIEQISVYSGVHIQSIDDLLNDRVRVNHEFAYRLAMATGIQKRVWLQPHKYYHNQ